MKFEFLIPIIAFSGLLVGYLINRFTKEELENGKNYFLWLKRIVIVILFFILLIKSYDRYVALVAGLVAGYFLRKEYLYIGLSLASGFYMVKEIIASLIFIFGLAYSGLNYKIIDKKQIIYNFVFFIAPFLILLMPSNLLNEVMAFSTGALLWGLDRCYI